MNRHTGIRMVIICFFILTLAGCTVVSNPDMDSDTNFLEDIQDGEPLSDPPDLPTVSCPDVESEPVTGFVITQPPDLDEPSPRTPYLDPVFGTCVVRVTDRDSDIYTDDPSPGLKNEYSRVQSFNADNSRLLVYGIEGTWYLYDTNTLQPMGQLPLDTEPRWSASDSDLLYYVTESRLISYNVVSGTAEVAHDFRADLPGQTPAAVWTRYEGSPSMDSRYWGLMAEDGDWLTSAFIIYDLEEDRIAAIRDVRSWPDVAREIDSVTISPLGNYFLAYLDLYCERGETGDDEYPCGLMVYDRDLENGRSLVRIIGHSDTALDANGREVLVFEGIDDDTISMLDLGTGEVTILAPIDYTWTGIGLHFSGRAFNKPGWVLVSTHDDDAGSHTWMDDKVFAMELKPGGQVIHLAHTHSIVNENRNHHYWAEPHAAVNQDFTKVLFTSNWGRVGSAAVEMYIVSVPDMWLP